MKTYYLLEDIRGNKQWTEEKPLINHIEVVDKEIVIRLNHCIEMHESKIRELEAINASLIAEKRINTKRKSEYDLRVDLNKLVKFCQQQGINLHATFWEGSGTFEIETSSAAPAENYHEDKICDTDSFIENWYKSAKEFNSSTRPKT